MDTDETTLTVITSSPAPRATTRGAADQARKLVEEGIPLDRLQQNFRRFLQSLQQIVGVEGGRVGSFALEEITFSAEIGTDGEFKLLGAGVGVSASSGVSFTLRRQPEDDGQPPND